MLTVGIAEDHAFTRKGLRATIEDALDARVVAEADTGQAALRLVDQHAPDVLVLDLVLPGLNGLEVVKQVRQRSARTKIVVLSMHKEDAYVLRALSEGASAYVLKEDAAHELIAAIGEAVKGRVFLSSGLPRALLEAEDAEGDASDRYELLTDREREVLQLIAEGHTSAEIGERLFISRRTVDKHRQNLMAKLELRNQAEVVRFALARGLIPFDKSE